MAQAKKKTGPRVKPIPMRICIACRRSETKRGLIRLVRDGAGRVALDPTGKRAGRGAYLCHSAACWDQALRRNGLTRALRVDVLNSEDRATLEQFARSLTLTEELAAPSGADAM